MSLSSPYVHDARSQEPKIADVTTFRFHEPIETSGYNIFIQPRLTLKSSTFYPQSAFKVSVRTALKPTIVSLYAITDWFCNPDAMCLLRGTDCIFKHSSG